MGLEDIYKAEPRYLNTTFEMIIWRKLCTLSRVLVAV